MNPGTSATSASTGGLDLSQFHAVFFEEAAENLDTMEGLLLELDLVATDDESLNAIFRCAHSLKGGAATFGFADVAALTHKMETLLDKLRRHELVLVPAMVDALLQAGDALRAQLARHQDGDTQEAVDTEPLIAGFTALIASEQARGPGPAVQPAVQAGRAARPAAPAAAADAVLAPGERLLELGVDPEVDAAHIADLLELFREIPGLGSIVALDADAAAPAGHRFRVRTSSTDDELFELFSFHVDRERLCIRPLADDAASVADSADDDETAAVDHEILAAADAATSETAMPEQGTAARSAPVQGPAGAARSGSAPRAGGNTRRAAGESSTLRVAVERIDQLINLVGELVITQAMLAQTSARLDLEQYQQLAAGLADLERNTRDLQESVMSIRMIPMSVVFARFPRMLRDLAAQLGKDVDFVTHGEATELDKGLVEKIVDPLVHLVRNSCDHGIELPEERRAAGKPEHGTISLAASHQGGSVVIEVRDDGRGMSREKLLAKARERGLHAPDTLSDAEVWMLVFEPGFSTATEVSDVSGRGVGMDVVKKNIAALSGMIEIDVLEGRGMTVRIRLPLTLAIMDGMSIRVGEETYILPLSSVVESFQLSAERLRTIGGARVIEVRDEYLPLVELERIFDVRRSEGDPEGSIVVVVEADGMRLGLLVDELVGQQQVVVKNLEANYRKVDNISGATIMGDGQVALIIDVGNLVRRSRH